jgi:hypothetical protein
LSVWASTEHCRETRTSSPRTRIPIFHPRQRPLFSPRVVIEAKIAEDDRTARDKATRIQHLGSLSTADMPPGQQKYQVIACIAGRGFHVRVEDVNKMLIATRGKVFTLKTLDRLVEYSNLAKFRTK